MKHNKKRNTAFLYEALVQELTKAIIEKNVSKKSSIVSILKEHFSKGSILHKELHLYKTLNETKGLERKLSEKVLYEARAQYSSLPSQLIFKEQSKVINKINKSVGHSVFSNFVSNYKDLASIAQIFNADLPVKERVLLEESMIDTMSQNDTSLQEDMKPIDHLAYNTFIKKFNSKYSDVLLKEQKDLLTNYLTSFNDNGLSLKMFLNEEIERVRQKVEECLTMKEIKQDEMMSSKTARILEKLEMFKQKECDQKMLGELLKIQYFVNEAQQNG
jgi:hypothetical protein